MKISHTSDYKVRRSQVYPTVTDQIDAIYKLTKSLKDQGITLPPEVMDWILAIDLVKETYPKGGSNGN